MSNTSYLSSTTTLHNSVKLESPVRTYGFVQLKKDAKIGRFTFINHNSTVFTNVHIGRYCSIGKNCQIGAFDHPLDWVSTSPVSYNMKLHFPDYDGKLQKLSVERPEAAFIGNDVWLGNNVVIKRGVTIGDGAVVAAGSFVSKDVAPYSIVGGTPAKLIRFRFDHETIIDLLNNKWWDLSVDELEHIDFSDIKKSIEQFKKINSNNSFCEENDLA